MRTAADGRAALDHLVEHSVDAIVLDVAMPAIDGLEVCRRLRAAGDRTPVLMLTARDAVADRVAGLDAGADDYLVKPFALKELKARLRALLRRSDPAGGPVRFADLELDPGAREVRRGGRRIELSRTEFTLLELFMAHPRQVLTRSKIAERVSTCRGCSRNSCSSENSVRESSIGRSPRRTSRAPGASTRSP